MAKGCDYSFSKPSPSALQAAGYTFACRYVGGSSGKRITLSEARALWAHKIDVVTNFEAFPQDPLGGFNTGVTHARTGDAQHKAAGGPPGKPIYFSLDWDVQPHEVGQVVKYFQGVHSVIGFGRTGAYGGIRIISYLFDQQVINYGWQTYAWSRGQWDGRAQLRQTHNGINIGGGQIDADTSQHADFGAWHGPQEVLGPPGGTGTLGPVSGGPWDPSPALSQIVDNLDLAIAKVRNYTAAINALRH